MTVEFLKEGKPQNERADDDAKYAPLSKQH